MIVGFTGTRKGTTETQKHTLMGACRWLGMNQAHHGDCTGADAEFALFANEHCLPNLVFVHPPTNNSRRAYAIQPHNIVLPAKEYHQRNHDIVNASRVLVACVAEMEEVLRSGTWATIQYARRQKKFIVICWPDGSATAENIPDSIFRPRLT